MDASKQYAARVTVGDCISNRLEAFHNPLPKTPSAPANPHHGLMRGIVELYSIDQLAYMNEFSTHWRKPAQL
jgi:hypothetical protein